MARPARELASEAGLVARARGGDDEAFRLLVEPYRRELHVHCYRMLGSLQDAEDLLQESLLRAWQNLGRFRGQASMRTWLYRIATNACLDALRGRSKRVLPADYVPAADPEEPPLPMVAEPIWLEPYPDALLDEMADPEARYAARETIELAFIAAIQLLAPRQRAVLILRDVLGWSAREAASLLGSTPASVNSALQRARAALQARRAGSAWEPSAGLSAEERALLGRYMRAFQAADVPALVGLLREDAVMTMPPDPTWFRGRQAIGAFLTRWVFPVGGSLGNAPSGGSRQLQGPRLVPTAANRQPAFAIYQRAEDGSFRALALQVLTVRAGLVGEITGFVAPELFPHFGLPAAYRD